MPVVRSLHYLPYDEAVGVPNVVVDGSPNESTVLTLSHWPGIPAPAGVEGDLSAEMAFRYLDLGANLHGDAEVVTNNHFDQDGLVGIFALARPAEAEARRDVLLDVAASGDFGTYRHRTAARISMVLARLEAPDRSVAGLELLPAMVDDIDAFRDLWGAEDESLTAAEDAIAGGRVTIEEEPGLDLAVVTVADDEPVGGGHRFAHLRDDGLHPIAIHNATGCFRLVVLKGRRYELRYRYESWVQYRTRRPLPRVDLAPLAAELNAAEDDAGSGGSWEADPVSALAPRLHLAGDGASGLEPDAFVARVRAHLRSAPPAWDPYDTD